MTCKQIVPVCGLWFQICTVELRRTLMFSVVTQTYYSQQFLAILCIFNAVGMHCYVRTYGENNKFIGITVKVIELS